jgi:hypothetical protein
VLIYSHFRGDISTGCGYSTSGGIARSLPTGKLYYSSPPFANSRVSKGLRIFSKHFTATSEINLIQIPLALFSNGGRLLELIEKGYERYILPYKLS